MRGMRGIRFIRGAALSCLAATSLLAQATRQTSPTSIYVPRERVPMEKLPPPKSDAHGHGPDNRTGTSPCGNDRLVAVYTNCAGSSVQTQPPNRNGRGGIRVWPVGIGFGLFDGLSIASIPAPVARQVNDQLSRNGPQFPESLRMSDFRVTGLAKGGWPVVVDYEAEPGAYVVLTVITQNANPAQAVLATPQSGRRLQLLRLPSEFGTTLKSAAFSIDATTSASDNDPRYLRIYGFGCGVKAVGSVAIDELRFGPSAVTSSDPETHFGFHAHTMFDKMKAEFMQVALIDRSMEGQLFDNKKIDRRVAEGESVNDQWSAKKARPGPIQFRVRGWMTVRGDSQGGDWVSAFSPDLVMKQ